MVYYSNGGFGWSDVYYMPIKLREFYWRELLHAKSEETKVIQESNKPSKQARPSKVRRRR
jgi:hypothetical protein